VKHIVFGIFMGIALGMAVSAVAVSNRQDTCQARLTSAHVSVCLDGKADKVKDLFR
jgi:hypothetical protein